jgi:hypothetical protein
VGVTERIGDILKAKALGLLASSTCANHSDWAYHISTSVLRLSVSRRDDLFKQAHAFSINVHRSIPIAVMMHATGACPLPICKREIRVDPFARATGFRGSKPAPNGDEMGIRPICFIGA